MTMTWTPEREGNWLFHCHIMHHVSPERRLAPPARRPVIPTPRHAITAIKTRRQEWPA